MALLTHQRLNGGVKSAPESVLYVRSSVQLKERGGVKTAQRDVRKPYTDRPTAREEPGMWETVRCTRFMRHAFHPRYEWVD